MSKRTTIRDIAKRAGVSPATVSRVLNHRTDHHISVRTQQRVFQVAQQLGYRPNRIARALVTGRRNMIGLSVPYLWYPFAPQVMHYVQEAFGALGYGMIAHGADTDVERYVADLDVVAQDVDGIIAVERADLVEVYLARRRHVSVPIVTAGLSELPEADCVRVDLSSGVQAALDHLLVAGRRRIAYMVPQISHHRSEVREQTYSRVMTEVGLPAEYIVVPLGTSASARQTLAAYVRENGVPEAILCCNDVTAIGAYRGLRDVGVAIPDECSLVGCDGIEATEHLDCPLSTIVQPVREMCKTACEFLLRRLEEPECPRQTAVLHAQFVARESSCAKPSLEDPCSSTSSARAPRSR